MIKVKHEGDLLINLMKYRPDLVDDICGGFIFINCTPEQWPNIKKKHSEMCYLGKRGSELMLGLFLFFS